MRLLFSNVAAVSIAAIALSNTSTAGNAFITAYWSEASTASNGKMHAFVSSSTQSWARFTFPPSTQGIGDAAADPFGKDVQFKINAINYDLYIGDNSAIPFQLFIGDVASSASPGDANRTKLLDPTQGLAVQFPFAAVYKGKGGGLCSFTLLSGYCVLGGDISLRGIRLAESGGSDNVAEQMAFGASAGLSASILFPIFRHGHLPGASNEDGHLGLSISARYYYQDANQEELLFGDVNGPQGEPVYFNRQYGAVSVQSEFDIYKYFKIRLEYFRAVSDRKALKQVFNASLVLSPTNQ